QVADFAAEYDPQLRTLLQRQLFSTPSVLSLAGVRQMLRPMADPLKCATLYLLLVDDNALEQWCDKCCFSLKHGGARYKSDKDEISGLLNAISEAL
ncbi:MAG: hypothetical protein ACLGJA_25705, partial [Gammaproteobacteria bacterium]